MKTYFCVVTNFWNHTIEIYRIVAETPQLQEDIEFMAGECVGADPDSGFDPDEQARVEQIWLDTFADRQPFATSDSPNMVSLTDGVMVFFEYLEKPVVERNGPKPVGGPRVPDTDQKPPHEDLPKTALRNATNDEAHCQGWWAHALGQPREVNPYGGKLHELWNEGWDCAECDDPVQEGDTFSPDRLEGGK